MSPANKNIDNSDPNNSILRGGNSCPVLLSAEVVKQLCHKYGYIYNPDYVQCGGYEDWDQGRRLQELGYGFGICSLVDVHHIGMGTRAKSDTRKDQVFNADTYHKYWNTWEQPGFELDMTEVGLELRKAFELKYPYRWYDK